MYLTADKVVNALVCAQRVLEDPKIFNGNGDLIPISIDEVKDWISENSGFSIEMRDVAFEGTYVFARVEKYKGSKAEIDVKSSLPEDWKRFVAAKELLHLVIDQEEDLSPYGDETLDKLVREGHIGVISQNGDAAPAQSELIAEVAAMELLYPIQNRLGDLSSLLEGKVTQQKLALHYGIPVNFVDTAFSKGYLEVIKKAFEERKED